MVLLDRSTLRLKAATAKLKKQAHCNMSRQNAQMRPRIATKRHKMHKELLVVLPALPVYKSNEIGNHLNRQQASDEHVQPVDKAGHNDVFAV